MKTMFELNKIVRKNILNLKPYSSARDEYSGKEAVFLDANENPFNTDYNRYPDPRQLELKNKIASLKKVDVSRIFLGNGSDEPIDLLFRVFCEPGKSNVIIPDPTYGMYEVCADINDIQIKRISLTQNYELDDQSMINAIDENTRLIFVCSPNNPTSNSFNKESVLKIIKSFTQGIVVLDEAYIDFSSGESLLPELNKYPNLVILQTFSKAWGLAGLRLGMAFASEEITELLTKVKYPYNINVLTQKVALENINDIQQKNSWVKEIIGQREWLKNEIAKLTFVNNILPSDTNFLMVKVEKARDLYDFLINRKIIVRDRSKVNLCMGYLRITVGTKKENIKLIKAMKEYKI